MKIRLIWDDCRPTIDRRPTTYEDIENDIHLQEFKKAFEYWVDEEDIEDYYDKEEFI